MGIRIGKCDFSPKVFPEIKATKDRLGTPPCGVKLPRKFVIDDGVCKVQSFRLPISQHTMQISMCLDRVDERDGSPTDKCGRKVRDGVLRNGYLEVRPIGRPWGEMAPIRPL